MWWLLLAARSVRIFDYGVVLGSSRMFGIGVGRLPALPLPVREANAVGRRGFCPLNKL
jgi:hypothetical protein